MKWLSLLLILSLVGCAAPPFYEFKQELQGGYGWDEHTLYFEYFNANNGTDEAAKFGKYSHGYFNEPVVIRCDEIGLVGSMQYTVEFWWLPPSEGLEMTFLVVDSSGGIWQIALHDMDSKQRESYIKWGFDVSTGGDLPTMRRIYFPRNEWMYIARTGDFKTGEHFIHVNGITVGVRSGVYNTRGWQNKGLAIVNDRGYVDGFRISNIIRPIYDEYHLMK